MTLQLLDSCHDPTEGFHVAFLGEARIPHGPPSPVPIPGENGTRPPWPKRRSSIIGFRSPGKAADLSAPVRLGVLPSPFLSKRVLAEKGTGHEARDDYVVLLTCRTRGSQESGEWAAQATRGGYCEEDQDEYLGCRGRVPRRWLREARCWEVFSVPWRGLSRPCRHLTARKTSAVRGECASTMASPA